MLKHAVSNRMRRLSIIATAAGLLLIPVIIALAPSGPAIAWASWLSPSRLDECPPLDEGSLVQGSAPEIYLLEQGARHWIPDLPTFRALGFDGGAVELLTDGCLEALPLGDPLPSILPASQPAASSAPVLPVPTSVPIPGRTASQPVTQLAPSGVPVDLGLMLTASAVELPVGATLTLTAVASTSDGGSYSLTIQRLRSAGGPSGGLVANCSGASICVGEARVTQPATVTFLATLYRCDASSACVAERSSESVTVRWR